MKDENMVSQSHFNMPEINTASSLEPPSLPDSYGETSIFLMTVAPYSAHIIWEVDADDMNRINQKGCQPVIKLHDDVTENLSSPPRAHTSFEVKINIDDKKSYIALPEAGRIYSAELGFKNADGHFFPLAQSNSAEAPRDTSAPELYPDHESAGTAPETSGAAAINKYINAIETINNPPPRTSFLPHIDMKPSFTSFDISSRQENPPREIHHKYSLDLTESIERRFIAGISSR